MPAQITLKFANSREGYRQVQAAIAEATAPALLSEVTIGGEATGPYWLSLYEALTHSGHRVLVLNPLDVKARRGTTLRGTKTDTVDAQFIATIIRQEDAPTSHIPEAAVQGLRELTRLRADWVGQIGDIKRRVIAVLDRTFPEFSTYFRDVFGLTARAVLEEWTLPEQLAVVSTSELTALLTRMSRGRCGVATSQAIHEAAQHNIGVRWRAEPLALELRLLLRQVTNLESQVVELDQEIARRYGDNSCETCGLVGQAVGELMKRSGGLRMLLFPAFATTTNPLNYMRLYDYSSETLINAGQTHQTERSDFKNSRTSHLLPILLCIKHIEFYGSNKFKDIFYNYTL